MSPRQARISGITATESGLTFGQRLGEDSWFKAHAMAVSTMRPALRRPPNERLARCGKGKMLGKVRSMSIAAATLLASPAFAGWPLAQPAQIERIDPQRIIIEAVINGGLTEAGPDEAPANELRPVPSWIDQGSVLDRQPQHAW